MISAIPTAPPDMTPPKFLRALSETSMVLRLYKASEKHGPISHYFVVVVADELVHRRSPEDFRMEDVSSTSLIGMVWLRVYYIRANTLGSYHRLYTVTKWGIL